MLLALDHVNIRTARLAELRRFYVEGLGLTDGARPPFRFPGAWLYCGDQAAVHLVGVAAAPAGRVDALLARDSAKGWRHLLCQHEARTSEAA